MEEQSKVRTQLSIRIATKESLIQKALRFAVRKQEFMDSLTMDEDILLKEMMQDGKPGEEHAD